MRWTKREIEYVHFAYRVLDYGKAFGDVPMASQVDTMLHIVQLTLPIVI